MEYTFVYIQPRGVWQFHIYNLVSFYSTAGFSFEQMIEMEPGLKQMGVALMVSQFMHHNLAISLFSFSFKICTFSLIWFWFIFRASYLGIEICGGTECAFLMHLLLLTFNISFQDKFNFFIQEKYKESEENKKKWHLSL